MSPSCLTDCTNQCRAFWCSAISPATVRWWVMWVTSHCLCSLWWQFLISFLGKFLIDQSLNCLCLILIQEICFDIINFINYCTIDNLLLQKKALRRHDGITLRMPYLSPTSFLDLIASEPNIVQKISLTVFSGALLPDYSHDLLTGYVINIHSCLKDITCNVCSSAKFLLAAFSKLNPFNAVFTCMGIIRIFSWQSALTVVCSSFKWIPWSLPVIWVAAYMGEFVQSKAVFEFTAQQLLQTAPHVHHPVEGSSSALTQKMVLHRGCSWGSIKNVRWRLSYFLTAEITLVFFVCFSSTYGYALIDYLSISLNCVFLQPHLHYLKINSLPW